MTRERLHGLAATLTIALLVAGIPLVLLAIGATPWNADLTGLPGSLTRRDDGTLALALLTLVVWVAWAVIAATLIAELVALIRGVRVPAIPGLALPQHGASQLVAIAALAFIAAPTALATLPTLATPAAAAPIPNDAKTQPGQSPATPTNQTATDRVRDAPAAPAVATVEYTVKRGDSLWRIAERIFGDGSRYGEIAVLNHELLGDRPDFIGPGTVLRIPDQSTGQAEAASYVVRDGDTLWDIAERELGNPDMYRAIFEASRDTVQPDGTRLTDPDLIHPGWHLTIPRTRQAATPAPAQSEPSSIEREPVAPKEQPAEPIPGSVRALEGPASMPGSVETEPQSSTTQSEDSVTGPGWLMPGLAGAGSVLAGCVFVAVRAHRRTQLRFRSPGQTLAPPPTDLLPVDKNVHTAGGPMADPLAFLDRALRHLSSTFDENEHRRPSITRVTLNTETVTVHLADSYDLPDPWEGNDTRWTIATGTDLGEADAIPPYPLLVSIGQADDGDIELINLEHFAIVNLSGDPDRAEALARHIAAELTLNPWSVLAQIHTFGVAAELAGLNDLRLKHHNNDDTEALEQACRELTAARTSGLGDPEPYRVFITPGRTGLENISSLLKAPGPRLGAALVILADQSPDQSGICLELTATGRLRCPVLDLDIAAAGLSSSEATACAAIINLTRDNITVPIPQFAQTINGWRAHGDQAGAIHEELTDHRGDGPAGESSLLSRATEDYVEVAATTTEDVETLAPIVPETTSRIVHDADPTLDADLEAWFNPDSRLPKLTLFGPVRATAHGNNVAVAKRRAYYTELLAYLALHPDGVTSRRIATDFNIGLSRARTDISTIREWLGTNRQTGEPHVPAGDASRAYRETGVAGYQVDDLLTDFDLFRRLRARGQAQGNKGIDDLTTALRLVKGQPFDQLRDPGWSWLLDQDRTHEIAACAIVDTAHIIITNALATNDLSTARSAAETACRAAPFDEICRLDLAHVTKAEGHRDAADNILKNDIYNRTDDGQSPIDPPERTRRLLQNRDHSTRRVRPA